MLVGPVATFHDTNVGFAVSQQELSGKDQKICLKFNSKKCHPCGPGNYRSKFTTLRNWYRTKTPKQKKMADVEDEVEVLCILIIIVRGCSGSVLGYW